MACANWRMTAMEGYQAMVRGTGFPEPQDNLREQLMAREPTVFVDPGHECHPRVEALHGWSRNASESFAD